MGLVLSFMGISGPFLGRTDAGGHLSVRSFLGACPGLGRRPLQAVSLSDVGVVTAPAYSLRFPSVSPCLLMAFEGPGGHRKL